MKLYIIYSAELAVELALKPISHQEFIASMKECDEMCIAFDFPTKAEAEAFLKGILFCNVGPMVLLREENTKDKALIDALKEANFIIEGEVYEQISGWDLPILE